MARSIVITSGKGGVGKSTLTANLGRSLAGLGQRVVLIDTDIGLNNLDVIMDIEKKIVYDLIDVIQNRCRPRQALIEDKVKNLYVMPSAHGYDQGQISGQHLRALINVLMQSFDYVLVDCPAGIEAGFHRAVTAANEAIVVTTPHISAIRDADKVIGLLKSYQKKHIYAVVNRARGDLIVSSEMVDYADVCQILKIAPVGVIPEDDAVNVLSNLGLTVNPKSAGFKAFEILARNVHFGSNVIFDVTKRYKGFLGGLRRKLRKGI
ncbi:MAG: septum site-determining protein MinD [Firmicutes bacterium]|nr:septum site-determining protein MinD [Bacillota bacterium]